MPAPSGLRDPKPANRLHVAIIAASDGVVATLAARDSSRLLSSLAEYVATHAPQRLWPKDAEEVLARLAKGDRSGAVAEYFARTGERWDCERLHQEVLDVA